MPKRIRILALLTAMALIFCLYALRKPKRVTASTLDYLGTVISMTVYGTEDRSVLDAPIRRIADIHHRMSRFEEDSEVSRLSRDGQAVLSPDTAALFTLSAEISAASGGAFDITIGPLVALWGIGGAHPRVPSQAEIDAARALVDDKKLDFTPGGGEARLGMPGMSIDLGGVAKGYACDEAVRILREDGVESAVLNLGGNIFALGKRPNGKDWRIGLRIPIIGEDGVLAELRCHDTAIVISGGYESSFESEGRIYQHILDPATGYPAESGLLCSVIVCESAARADALSTATFVLGADRAKALIQGMEGVSAIFVREDKSIVASEALRDSLRLKDARFRIESYF